MSRSPQVENFACSWCTIRNSKLILPIVCHTPYINRCIRHSTRHLLFLSVGFEVVVLKNPSKRDLKERLESMSSEIINHFDGALFYFSGHGEEGRFVLGGLDQYFSTQKVVDFLSVEGMETKPRVRCALCSCLALINMSSVFTPRQVSFDSIFCRTMPTNSYFAASSFFEYTSIQLNRNYSFGFINGMDDWWVQ